MTIDIVALLITVITALIAMFRSLYLVQETSIVERRLFSPKIRSNIYFSTFGIILLMFIIYSISLLYFTYVFHWSLVIFSIGGIIILVFYVGVLFYFNSQHDSVVFLFNLSNKNDEFNGYILKNKISEQEFSISNPYFQSIRLITFDTMKNYDLITFTKKEDKSAQKELQNLLDDRLITMSEYRKKLLKIIKKHQHS